MRLALVTHNLDRGGGQARVNYELVMQCLGAGIAVTLVAERVDAALLDAGAKWQRIRMSARRPDLLYVRNFVRYSDEVVAALAGQVDLVIANGFGLRRPHDVNISHFVHGAWLKSPVHVSRVRRGPYGWYHGAYSRCNARWERQSYAAARVVVAVSEKVGDELRGIGVPAAKIQVIVNGVDVHEFHPGAEDRSVLGLPARLPLALFVGDIRTPRKNLETVLRAVALAPQTHLIVVGDDRGSPYPAMTASLGLEHRVHFLGYRRDVPRLMRACDLFVFPSRYEACSLALLEALSSGLPVITAATAGGSELITPECGHVLADADDVRGLTEAMERLVQPGPQADARRRAARAVAERHSWARMADQYIRLFDAHLGKRNAAELVA